MRHIELEFLGGASEVGKTGILVEDKKTRVVLDYGVKIEKEPNEYPNYPGKTDAIILSHGHLDHSGAIPILYRKGSPEFIATDLTTEITTLLLKDSFKIAKKMKEHLPFGTNDYKKMLRCS